MKIVVQKYGGSSVADVARIRKVAERVVARHRQGDAVVVVVSAMGRTTDELLATAKQVSADPPRRELDMLLTCGERISMAVLSMALQELGVPAVSFTGSQSGIITTNEHSQARILEVRPSRVREELEKGRVVVVAGFQGVSRDREITTLGRGGSDTTAVALAAALGAEACEIYSDVDGVYSADPRIVPEASRLDTLSLDEMQALASAGAKVLNAQAVEFARERELPIDARHAHGEGQGTRVLLAPSGDGRRVKSITAETQVALIELGDVAGHLPALLDFLDGLRVRARKVSVEAARALVVIPLQDVHGISTLRAGLRSRFGDAVRLREDVGTVSAVGAGLDADFTPYREALACAAAIPAAVHASWMTALQLTLVVDLDQVKPLTRALHLALIPSLPGISVAPQAADAQQEASGARAVAERR